MAITHYIDTSVPEIARARMKSQTQRVPEAFPVLVFGDTRNHNWVFMNQGTIEAFSGDPTYTLRVTIGEVDLPPTNGSYKLTCGANTTGPLDALSDAVTVEAALNALAQITTDGGVKVTGTFPNFLITWANTGTVTGLSANSSLLVPQSNITLTTLFTGAVGVANQVSLQIRQAAITSQSVWSTISSPAAGWTGTLTTNTSGALTLLANNGVSSGDFIEVSTVLTAEVLNPSGFPTSFYQTPITLRAKNLDPSNTVSNSIAYYSLGDLVYGSAAGTLIPLPGTNSTQRQFLTQAGDGTNSAKPNWSTIQKSDLPNSELPSAPNTSVQVNIAGSFYGDANFTYTPATSTVTTLRYVGSSLNSPTNTNLTLGTPDSNSSIVLTPNGTGLISTSATTFSVTDGFTITSAGSIGLTAGSTDKNITLTPSDSGAQGAVTTRAAYGSQTIATTGGLQVIKQAVSGGVFPSIELIGYQNGQAAQMFYILAKAGGTQASPATTSASATLGAYRFYTRANSAWKNSGSISVSTTSTFSDSDFSTGMLLGPSSTTGQYNAIAMQGGNSSTGAGYAMVFSPLATLPISQAPTTYFTFDSNNLSRTAAWGTTGVNSAWLGRTYTDTVSSGTVATAVANSFAVPTFAASSATTFTNAANLYIAGDVANGTNVTLTNSYGLWNVGKTRLGNTVQIDGTNVLNFGATALGNIGVSADTTAGILQIKSPTSGTTTLYTANALSLTLSGGASASITGGAGNMTITAGTGASRTMTFQTTTAGSTATNWLVGDASQNTTAGGSITTSTPNGGTSGAWKFGIRVAATTIHDTTQYIQLDVGGTLYKLALAV